MAQWREMLQEAKELFEQGLIDESEFKSMKDDALQMRKRMTLPPTPMQDTFSGQTVFHAVGQTIGQYMVLEEIGRGGMGAVYRARHKLEAFSEQTGDVAIKLMNPDLTQDASFRERFVSEAAVGRNLYHQNLVRIHDVIDDDSNQQLAIVMDFVEGDSLDERIPTEGMDFEVVIPIVRQLCDAIDHMHQRGVVHRDLKPENIIISEDGNVTILDMGIAKIGLGTEQGQTSTGMAMGTPLYMAPEQLDAKSVTSAADRFALGLIVYKMLSGHLPWDASESVGQILSRKFSGDYRPLNTQAGAVATVVFGLLAPNPSNRYESCAMFFEQLTSNEVPEQVGESSSKVAPTDDVDVAIDSAPVLETEHHRIVPNNLGEESSEAEIGVVVEESSRGTTASHPFGHSAEEFRAISRDIVYRTNLDSLQEQCAKGKLSGIRLLQHLRLPFEQGGIYTESKTDLSPIDIHGWRKVGLELTVFCWQAFLAAVPSIIAILIVFGIILFWGPSYFQFDDHYNYRYYGAIEIYYYSSHLGINLLHEPASRPLLCAFLVGFVGKMGNEYFSRSLLKTLYTNLCKNHESFRDFPVYPDSRKDIGALWRSVLTTIHPSLSLSEFVLTTTAFGVLKPKWHLGTRKSKILWGFWWLSKWSFILVTFMTGLASLWELLWELF